ncbi:Plasmodium exported protein (hyp5), unknown, putative [Plasmodium sp.]|nr:Plasmodium exported protein (hyp5), unknown, putative [Plasmodium sp.]
MLFLSFKLFIFNLILNIILGYNKNNNIVNVFGKIKNNKQFHIRIDKSLAESIKNENRDYESKEFYLLYNQLVKQKLKNYTRLMDLRKKEKSYEKKKLGDKKWQDRVVNRKMKQYYILRDMLNCENDKCPEIRKKIISHNDRKNIKDQLYEIIFKGTSFWKKLGCFLQLLSICAVGSVIFVSRSVLGFLLLYVPFFKGAICTKILSEMLTFFSSYLIVFSGIYGASIVLIIIIIVVVIFLLVWLWPKDDKNIINKM